MTNATPFPIKPSLEPSQKRAKETYRSLLKAAQEILADQGIEALNSNAIVERAGVTAPAFYRYFQNKHGLLAVLGSQLMEAQNSIVEDLLAQSEQPGALTQKDATEDLLRRTLEVTETFQGGYALIVSLRAIPSLRDIRLASHTHLAQLLAARYLDNATSVTPDLRAEIYDRCRLASELGYAAVEMLLETQECDRDRILSQTASAIRAILDPTL